MRKLRTIITQVTIHHWRSCDQVNLLKSFPLRLYATYLTFTSISFSKSLDWTNVSCLILELLFYLCNLVYMFSMHSLLHNGPFGTLLLDFFFISTLLLDNSVSNGQALCTRLVVRWQKILTTITTCHCKELKIYMSIV